MNNRGHRGAVLTRTRLLAREMFRRSIGVVPQLYSWRIRSQSFTPGTVHEPDFEVFRGCAIKRAIDVGANRGQSIVSIKSVAPEAEILALEPNLDLVAALERVAAMYEGVQVAGVGCAASTGMRILYTPVARGIVFDQWASLQAIAHADALAVIKENGFSWCEAKDVSVKAAACVVVPLDAIISAPERTVDLLKIDSEGSESEVIAGANELINRDKPLLLAERPSPRLIELLQGRGYEHYQSLQGENSLFIDPLRNRGVDGQRLERLFVKVQRTNPKPLSE
jgi:FkbM family methyltransferase